MTGGYLGGAVGVLRRSVAVDALIALYSVGLVLAYAVTRDTLPVEPLGLATKVAETGVALIAGALFIRASR